MGMGRSTAAPTCNPFPSRPTAHRALGTGPISGVRGGPRGLGVAGRALGVLVAHCAVFLLLFYIHRHQNQKHGAFLRRNEAAVGFGGIKGAKATCF